MEKPLLQKNGAETTGHQHAKTSKINLDMDLTSFTKKLTPNGFRPKSKLQNHETMYLLCLEDNIGKNLDDPGYTGGFLGVVQHQGHEKTSLINWNLLKYKTSVLKKTRSEREDKSQTGTKYLQKTHLIKNC